MFTPLLFPGAQQTAAWDISPAGNIVGNYRDASGVNRAFVLSRDGYVSIDVPGATLTRAWGINAAGDIVGSYVAAGVTHGYVARRGLVGESEGAKRCAVPAPTCGVAGGRATARGPCGRPTTA